MVKKVSVDVVQWNMFTGKITDVRMLDWYPETDMFVDRTPSKMPGAPIDAWKMTWYGHVKKLGPSYVRKVNYDPNLKLKKKKPRKKDGPIVKKSKSPRIPKPRRFRQIKGGLAK